MLLTEPASPHGKVDPCSTSLQLVRVAPDSTIREKKKAGENGQERHHAEAEALALLHPGFGRPGEERDHIMSFLIEIVRRAVGKGDRPVAERRRHGYVPVLEIGIVIFVRQHLEPGGRL